MVQPCLEGALGSDVNGWTTSPDPLFVLYRGKCEGQQQVGGLGQSTQSHGRKSLANGLSRGSRSLSDMGVICPVLVEWRRRLPLSSKYVFSVGSTLFIAQSLTINPSRSLCVDAQLGMMGCENEMSGEEQSSRKNFDGKCVRLLDQLYDLVYGKSGFWSDF